MKKLIITTLCLLASFFSPLVVSGKWGDGALYKKTELNLDTTEIEKFDIDVGAGDINIIGKENGDGIEVKASIYGDNIDENDFTLVLKKRGQVAILEAHFVQDRQRNGEKIDLDVFMPSSLALSLDDRSGDISVELLKSGLTVNDRSGDIELNNVSGSVTIEDRSGDISGNKLAGEILVKDRSGDVNLENLESNVTIDDSSGDVYIKNATGKVTVSDSSGDIRVNGAGSFKLKNDGSGQVVLKNIQDR